MAKKQALILQSWFSKTTDNWYPWLKSALEKRGYAVFFPDLPTIRTKLPNLTKILQKINQTMVINKNTIVIGHSIGTLVAMRLAEKHPIKKMILISGWDFNDLTKEHRLFWPTPLNHRKIKAHVKDIVVIQGEHDPYLTAYLAEEMSKRLNGKFMLIKGLGHFGNDDHLLQFPQLLKYI